ncbi:MAG: hypothetical protein V3U64_06965 [Cocleimonas sp.]
MKNMKKSLLSWLLGASLVIAAPAAMADNQWKQQKQNSHNKHQQKQAQKHKQKKHNKRQNKQYSNTQKKKHSHNNDRKWINGYGWDDRSYDRKHDRRYDRQDYRKFTIHQRLNNQSRKIRKGVKKGQLVRWEARKLRNEQHRIENRLSQFRYDGRLNRYERKKIHKLLDVAGKNIRNKRHNHITKRSQRNSYDRNRYDRHNQHKRYPRDSRYEFVINW